MLLIKYVRIIGALIQKEEGGGDHTPFLYEIYIEDFFWTVSKIKSEIWHKR